MIQIGNFPHFLFPHSHSKKHPPQISIMINRWRKRKTFKKTNLLINVKAKGNRQGHFQHRYCIAKAAQNSLQWICTSNCIFNAFFLNIYVQNTRLYQGAHPHGYLHIHSPKAIDCVPAYRLDRGRALNVFLLQWQRQPSLLLLLFFFYT